MGVGSERAVLLASFMTLVVGCVASVRHDPSQRGIPEVAGAPGRAATPQRAFEEAPGRPPGWLTEDPARRHQDTPLTDSGEPSVRALGTNVLVSQDSDYFAETEPTISVSPINPLNLVAGAIDDDLCGYYASLDGGK